MAGPVLRTPIYAQKQSLSRRVKFIEDGQISCFPFYVQELETPPSF
jgi:hypothetical protein